MMHVENRVNRAHMLAQEWLTANGNTITEDGEDIIATQILLAELINALQGLDYKGEETVKQFKNNEAMTQDENEDKTQNRQDTS